MPKIKVTPASGTKRNDRLAFLYCFKWIQVFTNGSAEEAVKIERGRRGVFIKHTDGKLTARALPAGKISYN